MTTRSVARVTERIPSIPVSAQPGSLGVGCVGRAGAAEHWLWGGCGELGLHSRRDPVSLAMCAPECCLSVCSKVRVGVCLVGCVSLAGCRLLLRVCCWGMHRQCQHAAQQRQWSGLVFDAGACEERKCEGRTGPAPCCCSVLGCRRGCHPSTWPHSDA